MKRFVSIFVLTLSVISIMCSAVTVASADNTPTILVESENVSAGDTFQIEITMENNPGTAFMLLRVHFDNNVFTIVDVDDKGTMGEQMHSNRYSSPYTLFWMNALIRENITNNGELVVITFKVADDAASGDYTIKVDYDKSNDEIMDVDFNLIDFDIVNGTVHVDGNDQDENASQELNVEFNSTIFTYDGTEKRIEVEGELPNGASVEYSNNKAVDAGYYNAVAVIKIPGQENVVLKAILAIDKKELNIVGLSAKDKIYDRSASAELIGGILVGKVNGDDVYAVIPSEGYFEDSDVGINKTVIVPSVSLAGEDKNNYRLTQPDYLKASIVAEKITEPSVPNEPDDIWINPFTDVSEVDWYYSAVEYASKKGIMNGVASDRFAPNDSITRAMFVTVLYRIEDSPNSSGSVFTDIEKDSWYEAAVAWANENGIVNGVSPTEFAPGNVITREQMAAMIYRYAAFKGYDTESNTMLAFSDASEISDYAQLAMSWSVKNGLITGNGDGTVTPKAFASRAQAATILKRMAEKLG